MPQMQHWSVCQICGRVTPRGTGKDWIDAPLRYRKPGDQGRGFHGEYDPHYRIVRCPLHWSEWALRNSIGRTNANRKRMAELKANPPVLPPPHIEPFPMHDIPLDAGEEWMRDLLLGRKMI